MDARPFPDIGMILTPVMPMGSKAKMRRCQERSVQLGELATCFGRMKGSGKRQRATLCLVVKAVGGREMASESLIWSDFGASCGRQDTRIEPNLS